jgi:hypothetical protein
MTRTRSRRRKPARKEPFYVYRPTADEPVWLADEIGWELEFHIEQMEKACRNKRITPEERAEWKRKIVETETIVELVRRDPARLCAIDLRIAIRLKDFKATACLPPADRRAFTGTFLGREIHNRMMREDPRLRAMIMEDPK